MAESPTRRSLRYLRDLGYTPDVVERYLHVTKKRKDLFGFIDLIAVRDGEILGVQTTSASNQAARLTKAMGLPTLRQWLAAGGRFEVHGWRLGAVGKRKRWLVNVRRVSVEDLSPPDDSGE